jgi:hypothetical protein
MASGAPWSCPTGLTLEIGVQLGTGDGHVGADVQPEHHNHHGGQGPAGLGVPPEVRRVVGEADRGGQSDRRGDHGTRRELGRMRSGHSDSFPEAYHLSAGVRRSEGWPVNRYRCLRSAQTERLGRPINTIAGLAL